MTFRRPDPARTVAMLSALMVAGGWFFWESTAPAAQSAAPAARALARAGPPVADLEPALNGDVFTFAARLRVQRAAAAARVHAARDPFQFAISRAPAPVLSPHPPGASVTAEQAAVTSEPELVLVGVGEDAAEGKPLRTAVVAGPNDEMWMVREGQRLGRYRVEYVGEDFAVIVDVITAVKRRLVLR